MLELRKITHEFLTNELKFVGYFYLKKDTIRTRVLLAR